MFSYHSNSSSKVTISPGQALLILLDKYMDNPELASELNSLYLMGADNEENEKRILELLKDSALDCYDISFSANTINKDPTRRYFESYLAYLTLYSNISQLRTDDLIYTFKTMLVMLPEHSKDRIYKYLIDKIPVENPNGADMEFQDALFKIESKEYFFDFSEFDINKMQLLINITYTSLHIINFSLYPIPLNLYGKGYYRSANRGRTESNIDEIEDVRSCSFGLMKSYMPLPLDDILMHKKPSNYTRIADRNTFDLDGKWAVDNFKLLVHPFSASISGTMLAVIRSFYKLLGIGHFRFNTIDSLAPLFKSLISLLLYNSGGHTLHEFSSVINLPEVKKAFNSIKGFDELNLKSMFLKDNEEIFDAAIDLTIAYNKSIIKKMMINTCINPTINRDTDLGEIKLHFVDILHKANESILSLMPSLTLLKQTAYDMINEIKLSVGNILDKSCNSTTLIIDEIHRLRCILQLQNTSLLCNTTPPKWSIFFNHKSFTQAENDKLTIIIDSIDPILPTLKNVCISRCG